jgi:hypothetical protein
MATMDDQAKQAFTAASEWSKQIMTLSTGIVTLTVTFADKIFGDLTTAEKWVLVIAWLLYVVSILGGIWVLTTLTSTLAYDRDVVAGDVQESQLQAAVQVFPFIAATLLIAVFGALSLGN